jgi:hypothetical protein
MNKASATVTAEAGATLHSLRTEEHAGTAERNGRYFPAKIEMRENFRALLNELRAPPNELVKQRGGWTDRSGKEHIIDYVEWHTVADRLDQVAPNWSYAIQGLQQIGDILAVTAAKLITAFNLIFCGQHKLKLPSVFFEIKEITTCFLILPN